MNLHFSMKTFYRSNQQSNKIKKNIYSSYDCYNNRLKAKLYTTNKIVI
jgi:hypothetical protein